MYRNLFLMLGIIFAIGCSETPLDQILKESSQPTSEIANKLAICYQSLDIQMDAYLLNFNRQCIDNLIAPDKVDKMETVSIDVDDLLKNPSQYNETVITFTGFVNNIFTHDNLSISASIVRKGEHPIVENNALLNTIVLPDVSTKDVLALKQFWNIDTTPNQYVKSLIEDKQYEFKVFVLIFEDDNGIFRGMIGFLLDPPKLIK